MIKRNRGLIWLMAIAAFLIGMTSRVEALAGPASESIQRTHEQVLRVLHDPESRGGEREQRLVLLVAQRFSWREMSRHILSTHWDILEEKDRAEFVRLFRLLFLKSYANHIDRYADQRIEYLDERVVQGRAVVQTKLISPHRELLLNFWLFERLDEWHIYDVVVNGMSLIENYRGQFLRVLRNSSYAQLIMKMQDKVCPAGCSDVTLDNQSQ